jgi:hypothetical protein
MKAIQQIIHFLRGDGTLNTDDLAVLASKGFVDWSDVWSEVQYDEDPTPAEPVGSAEATVPPTPLRRPKAKRGRDVVRKGRVVSEKSLRSRLRGCAEAWPNSLDGMLRVGRRIAPCATWAEAALVIRNAEPQALQRAVAKALEKRDPPLDVFWDAVFEDNYRDAIKPAEYGPAVSAYRAVLASNDVAHIGRHAKLLGRDEVAQVHNVKLAQRRMCRAFEPMFSHRGDIIAASMQRDFHPLAYWTMVLLYNARRSLANWPAPTAGEHKPARQRPDDRGWMRVWAGALAMDPKSAAPFLGLYTQSLKGFDAMMDVLRKSDARFLKRFFAACMRHPSSSGQTAMSEFAVVISRLRVALNELSLWPQDDQWQDFLKALGSGMAGLPDPLPIDSVTSVTGRVLDRYFGLETRSVCPKSWDWKTGME